ncbi:hypothetical protein Dimus_035556 [Dionaea muscipula]
MRIFPLRVRIGWILYSSLPPCSISPPPCSRVEWQKKKNWSSLEVLLLVLSTATARDAAGREMKVRGREEARREMKVTGRSKQLTDERDVDFDCRAKSARE